MLGVSPGSSWEEVRRAYRTKAKLYHPDANPEELRGWAEEQMKLLNLAFAAAQSRRAQVRRPEVLASTDPYVILGVGPDASDDEVERVYQASLHAWHPEFNPGYDRTEGLRAVARLDDAYRRVRSRGQ